MPGGYRGDLTTPATHMKGHGYNGVLSVDDARTRYGCQFGLGGGTHKPVRGYRVFAIHHELVNRDRTARIE